MTIDFAETVEAITPKLLKQAFVRWQQAQEPPSELLSLALLSTVAMHSTTTKSLFLYDFIFDMVMTQLQTLRGLARTPHDGSIPEAPDAIFAGLARDFGAGQQIPAPELAAWSALFHRYLLPVRISPTILADAAGISDRSLRRHLALGLRYLAQALRRREWAACQKARPDISEWVDQPSRAFKMQLASIAG